MSFHFEWKYDEDADDIHIYDSQGTELQDSPISGDGAREIPGDLLPVVASEMKYEYNQNGFGERVIEMMVVMADPNHLQQVE